MLAKGEGFFMLEAFNSLSIRETSKFVRLTFCLGLDSIDFSQTSTNLVDCGLAETSCHLLELEIC